MIAIIYLRASMKCSQHLLHFLPISLLFSFSGLNALLLSVTYIPSTATEAIMYPCACIVYQFWIYMYSSWDSSVGIGTRYGLDGPGIESQWGVRFSTPIQTSPGAHPASYTQSFPGLKQPGRGVDHPTPSRAKVKDRVQPHFYSHSGPSWPVLG
jgi:hypothetical protein